MTTEYMREQWNSAGPFADSGLFPIRGMSHRSKYVDLIFGTDIGLTRHEKRAAAEKEVRLLTDAEILEHEEDA